MDPVRGLARALARGLKDLGRATSNGMDEKISKEVQERLGQLLAESPLAGDLKQLLLGSLDKIPDFYVFDLIDALEKEDVELERIAQDVRLFLQKQGDEWQEVAAKQQETADKIVEEEIRKLEDEAKLEQARQKLQS